MRDSSLSACTQAVIAAETGHLGLAYDYLGEAALMDLLDLEHNTRDGVHIASLAGTWIALVSGFGGLRLEGGTLSFSPRLPEVLTRLAFTLFIRGRRLRVEITPSEATYALADDGPLQIWHHRQAMSLSAGKPQARPIPAAPPRADARSAGGARAGAPPAHRERQLAGSARLGPLGRPAAESHPGDRGDFTVRSDQKSV